MTSRKINGAQAVPLDVATIRQVPLFAQLTDAQAGQIVACVTRRRFGKNKVIVQRGHKSDMLFILLTGRAHVAVAETRCAIGLAGAPTLLDSSEQGGTQKLRKSGFGFEGEPREVIVALLHPGDHFGDMSLIDGSPHGVTVRAEVASEVLLLGRSDFMRCLAENLALTYAVMKSLVRRLRQADVKIQSLALMDVHGRVAQALLERAVIDPATGEGRIGERLSRQYLAKVVGASREMVSRVMKDLKDRGFIVEHADRTATLRSDMLRAP
ncbi:MAG: Crp/Fnr family transcriptional regulator [Burkholderiaceae bacterium]|nr:Crp/Fnr family transcriptional regulator [Burkholderiaceae bacterium]